MFFKTLNVVEFFVMAAQLLVSLIKYCLFNFKITSEFLKHPILKYILHLAL